MSTSELKLCPYCGEEIRAIAVRCKHCHMMLDGSGKVASTTTPNGEGGSVAGGNLTTAPGGNMPGAPASRLRGGTLVGAGRYELKRLLGKGGMGEVFLAEHTYTGQKVALKVVWPNLMDAEGPRKRFLQEGRVLAKLKHKDIVGLTDFFEEDGRFFLAMEYVEGETLASYLERRSPQSRALAVDETVGVLRGILGGLAHAHAQSVPVVHRDIKPSNVMVAGDGRIVLMDFGIAKVAGEEKITHTAGVVGTYEYMSPEQVAGQEVSPASDVYAVGILAYELLTGDVPFPQKSDTGYDAMEGHRHKAPPQLLERCPQCPPHLVDWVNRALAKSPANRFQSAQEMLEALDSLPTNPSAAVSPLPPAKPAEVALTVRPDGRRPWFWLMVGGIGLFAMAILALVAVMPSKKFENRPSGPQERVQRMETPRPAQGEAPKAEPVKERLEMEEPKAEDAAGLQPNQPTENSKTQSQPPEAESTPAVDPAAVAPALADEAAIVCYKGSFIGEDLDAYNKLDEYLINAQVASKTTLNHPEFEKAVAAAREAVKGQPSVERACQQRLQQAEKDCRELRLKASKGWPSKCIYACQEAKRAICDKSKDRDCAQEFCRLTFDQVKQALGECIKEDACEPVRAFGPKQQPKGQIIDITPI